MNKIIWVTFFLFSINISFGQLTENFSDGELSNNPTWNGDLPNFQVTNGELQLNAPDAGSSSWEIYTRLDFDPSGSNQLRIYLQLDNQDVMAANGYFIEIGETGSEDNLQFYRLDAGDEELIAEGTLGTVASSPEFRLRIIRITTVDLILVRSYNFQIRPIWGLLAGLV